MTLMAQDMREQPAVLARLVDRFDADVERVKTVVPDPLGGVTFVARGSSDNAAVFGRYLAELAGGRPAGLAAPSLLTLYNARVDYRGQLAVALSQSGETPEIVDVCEQLRKAGARTVAIVNDADSPLAEAVEVVLAVNAGPERAVPATKTVTGQLLAVAAVAAALGQVPFDGAISPRSRRPSPTSSTTTRGRARSPPAGGTPSGCSSSPAACSTPPRSRRR